MALRRARYSSTMRLTETAESGESRAAIVATWMKAVAQELLLIISVSMALISSAGATPIPIRQPHMA